MLHRLSGVILAIAAAIWLLEAGSALARAPVVLIIPVGRDTAVARADPAFGGAITSLRFRGQEYIDRKDHGRELQGAIWLYGRNGVINPTQAGSCHDTRTRGSSRLLSSEVAADHYASRTDMAIWWLTRYKCSGSGLKKIDRDKAVILSGVIHSQTMRPGFRGFANAVQADIGFSTSAPADGARVEALTAYMPAAFRVLEVFDPSTGDARPHAFPSNDTGEQDLPVVVSTIDGKAAMAVLSLTDDPKPRYNAFAFPDSTKWNLVFYPPEPYQAGDHDYEAVWIFGSRDEVLTTLRGLTEPPAPAN